MRILFMFGPLLISVVLVQLGVGVLGPLDVLSAAELDAFSVRDVGLLGSAHFVGFLAGCLVTPWLMARAGHSRAFAALSAVGVIATLLHPVFPDPNAWILLRIAAGFTVAGAYTVIESWLHARLPNRVRGRVTGFYRMADMTGAIGSQLLISQLEPASYISYNLVAATAALALLPLSLTTRTPPPPPSGPRIRLKRAFFLAPLGAVGAFVVGLTASSFRMVGPLYGLEFNLDRTEIAVFLAAGLLGGAAAQPIVGMIADRFERRRVLIGVSAFALTVCATLAFGAAGQGATSLTVGAFLFGASALPLYAVSAAYANDHCPRDFVVELNASLLVFFALGAILSPTVSAELIGAFGSGALWAYIGCGHAFLVMFGLWRLTVRPDVESPKPFRPAPRTSIMHGRLMKNDEDADTAADDARPPRDTSADGHDPEATPAAAPKISVAQPR